MDVNMIFTMLGGSNRIETDMLKKTFWSKLWLSRRSEMHTQIFISNFRFNLVIYSQYCPCLKPNFC